MLLANTKAMARQNTRSTRECSSRRAYLVRWNRCGITASIILCSALPRNSRGYHAQDLGRTARPGAARQREIRCTGCVAIILARIALVSAASPRNLARSPGAPDAYLLCTQAHGTASRLRVGWPKPSVIPHRLLFMNGVSNVLVLGLAIALAACGLSTQSDAGNASRSVDTARARQNAGPTLDAADHDLAEAREQVDTQVAEAHAAANREINKDAMRRSRERARAEYGQAIARVDGDLSRALEKCGMQAADARTACQNDARVTHNQLAEIEKVKLSLADQQSYLMR